MFFNHCVFGLYQLHASISLQLRRLSTWLLSAN